MAQVVEQLPTKNDAQVLPEEEEEEEGEGEGIRKGD
jgi:hypothetical protein